MSRASPFRRVLQIAILCTGTVAAQQPAVDPKPVESRAITGRVVNESGQPLAGVSVVALHAGGATAQRTSTANEGYFKLERLDAGLYRLVASFPGYVSEPQQVDPNDARALYRPGDSVSLRLIRGGVIAGFVHRRRSGCARRRSRFPRS